MERLSAGGQQWAGFPGSYGRWQAIPLCRVPAVCLFPKPAVAEQLTQHRGATCCGLSWCNTALLAAFAGIPHLLSNAKGWIRGNAVLSKHMQPAPEAPAKKTEPAPQGRGNNLAVSPCCWRRRVLLFSARQGYSLSASTATATAEQLSDVPALAAQTLSIKQGEQKLLARLNQLPSAQWTRIIGANWSCSCKTSAAPEPAPGNR